MVFLPEWNLPRCLIYFLSNLLPEITDMAELKVTLHIFRLLYYKKGSPQFVTFNELSNDVGLMS